VRATLAGWSSSSDRRTDGAVDSEQRLAAPEPVVEATEQGAGQLGAVYWREVERFMRGLVAAETSADGSVILRLRPGSVVLLAFGAPEMAAADGGVRCTYPIVGGLLARTPGGTISFAQESGPPLALASAISGFFPRLAAAPGRPGWTGALYEQVQRRLHLAVSKRYFRALLAGERK
jgi:hypothetical protein